MCVCNLVLVEIVIKNENRVIGSFGDGVLWFDWVGESGRLLRKRNRRR